MANHKGTCPKCKETIEPTAKRCKHCQADLRNWFIRHKIITGIFGLFSLGFIGVFGLFMLGIMISLGSVNNDSYTSKSSSQNVTSTTSEKDTVEKVEPVVDPEPIELTGIGQQVSDNFTVEDGLSIFELTHAGGSNFSVWLLNDEGEQLELLVNEIGDFDGNTAVSIPKEGEYVLDISAEGPWTVKITQPRNFDNVEVTHSFSGIGQTATQLFQLEEGLNKLQMNHDGSSNFSVWILDQDGKSVDLLVNEIGSFDGSAAFKAKESEVYIMNISADGDWSINDEKE